MFARLLIKAMERKGSKVGDLARWCQVEPREVEAWRSGTALPKPAAATKLRLKFPTLRSLHLGAMAQMSKDAAAAAADDVITAEQAESIERAREAEVKAELQVMPQPPAPPRDFPSALRWYRLREGMTSEEVGELLEIHGASVRAWEIGRSNPVVPNLVQLGSLFPDLAAAIKAGVVDAPDSRSITVPVGRAGNPKPVEAATVTPIRQAPAPNEVTAAGAAYADALRALEVAKLSVGQADAAVVAAQEAAIAARAEVSAAEQAAAESLNAMTQAVARSVAQSIGGAK